MAHVCNICDRGFVSKQAQKQHRRDAHGASQPPPSRRRVVVVVEEKVEYSEDSEDETVEFDPPFAGAVGEWVEREEFTGHKSFGRFTCRWCRKWWLSAHAMPEFRQGCKACEKESLPSWMWVNEDDDRRRSDEREEVAGRPHDEQRCEACRQGVCLGETY